MTLHQEQPTCDKPHCYFCQKMNEKPRPKTIMLPTCAEEKLWTHWDSSEVQVLVDNITLPISRLMSLIPTRSKSAINTKRCLLIWKLGVKYDRSKNQYINAS